LKEIARLLKPSGRFILQVNIYNDIKNLKRDELDKKQHPHVFDLQKIKHFWFLSKK